ncbi:hypothetical protein CSA80_03165 [Candidatus Saccharibacteria bacterium]|nr:MAG: hypothetical protein CSA80_03165 [Candidatus Saccharibacteria bacterium]
MMSRHHQRSHSNGSLDAGRKKRGVEAIESAVLSPPDVPFLQKGRRSSAGNYGIWIARQVLPTSGLRRLMTRMQEKGIETKPLGRLSLTTLGISCEFSCGDGTELTARFAEIIQNSAQLRDAKQRIAEVKSFGRYGDGDWLGLTLSRDDICQEHCALHELADMAFDVGFSQSPFRPHISIARHPEIISQISLPRVVKLGATIVRVQDAKPMRI